MLEVIVLDAVAGAGHWTGLLPWWLWLVVGVVCLVLLTCAASHLLRAAGVIADERELKLVSIEMLELKSVSIEMLELKSVSIEQLELILPLQS